MRLLCQNDFTKTALKTTLEKQVRKPYLFNFNA